jgi:hypothetical protein
VLQLISEFFRDYAFDKQWALPVQLFADDIIQIFPLKRQKNQWQGGK